MDKDNIEWLKQKQDMAHSDFERYNAECQDAARVLEKARKSFNLWTQVLIEVMQDSGLGTEEEEKKIKSIPGRIATRGPSLADLIQERIEEKGPLSIKEIQHELKERGKEASLAVLNTTLSRWKLQGRFNKGHNNKWCIVT